MRFSGALAPHPCRFLVATGDEMGFLEFHTVHHSPHGRHVTREESRLQPRSRVQSSPCVHCVRMSNRLGLGNVTLVSSISVMEN